jgi:hypothetical protein
MIAIKDQPIISLTIGLSLVVTERLAAFSLVPRRVFSFEKETKEPARTDCLLFMQSNSSPVSSELLEKYLQPPRPSRQ